MSDLCICFAALEQRENDHEQDGIVRLEVEDIRLSDLNLTEARLPDIISLSSEQKFESNLHLPKGPVTATRAAKMYSELSQNQKLSLQLELFPYGMWLGGLLNTAGSRTGMKRHVTFS